MISHQEAEILTSSRQDAPLDPVVERELQAHLATCDQCRAFAAATERLSAGLRSLPTLPASPRVHREVMGKARAGRGPLAGWVGGIGTGWNPGPAIATLAAVLLIALFGWFAFNQIFVDGGNNENKQIAAIPTEVPGDSFAPTATLAPPTATNVPDPTATTVLAQQPEPTATSVPQPTATTAPVPTATTAPVPTATNAPPPTATLAPDPTTTTVAAATDVPEDLTAVETSTSAVVATELKVTEASQPTATTAPVPTATTAPQPTATTASVPTATVAPEPTTPPTTEPTPTVGIEPLQPEGTQESDASAQEPNVTEEATVAESTAATDVAPETEETVIEPADGTGGPLATELVEDLPATAEAPTADGQIEPIDAETQSTPTEVPEVESATEVSDASESTSLMDASVDYTGIDGDPSGHLGLTQDGRLVFTNVPDGANFGTQDGYVLTTATNQPGVVQLCSGDVCEAALEAPEDATWQGDVPMGVSGSTAYVLRMYGDRSEILAGTPQGPQLVDAAVVLDLAAINPPYAVYVMDGTLYAWIPTGQWLVMQDGSAQVLAGSFSDPRLVRFAPSAANGPLMGYFSGGTLVIAPVSSPDAAVLTLPAEGIDHDIAPAGDRIALIRGNDIVIYDIAGAELTVFEGGDSAPSSIIWLKSGIVWVDSSSGLLYQIPTTAP